MGRWITTYGSRGVRIERRDRRKRMTVHAAKVAAEVDLAGLGGTFRACFVWAYAKMRLERATQASCTLAAVVTETLAARSTNWTTRGTSKHAARHTAGRWPQRSSRSYACDGVTVVASSTLVSL